MESKTKSENKKSDQKTQEGEFVDTSDARSGEVSFQDEKSHNVVPEVPKKRYCVCNEEYDEKYLHLSL